MHVAAQVIRTFTEDGGLGISFSDDWEIEEISEGSQAEKHKLWAPGLWLTHIQGKYIVGHSTGDEFIYGAFKAAGRPIKLGFITYKPPTYAEYDTASDHLTQARTPPRPWVLAETDL